MGDTFACRKNCHFFTTLGCLRQIGIVPTCLPFQGLRLKGRGFGLRCLWTTNEAVQAQVKSDFSHFGVRASSKMFRRARAPSCRRNRAEAGAAMRNPADNLLGLSLCTSKSHHQLSLLRRQLRAARPVPHQSSSMQLCRELLVMRGR